MWGFSNGGKRLHGRCGKDLIAMRKPGKMYDAFERGHRRDEVREAARADGQCERDATESAVMERSAVARRHNIFFFLFFWNPKCQDLVRKQATQLTTPRSVSNWSHRHQETSRTGTGTGTGTGAGASTDWSSPYQHALTRMAVQSSCTISYDHVP